MEPRWSPQMSALPDPHLPNSGVTGAYHYAELQVLIVCLVIMGVSLGLKLTDNPLPRFPETKLGTGKGLRLKRRCLDSTGSSK